MELIDIGRAKIDTALKNNDKQTALLTAQRLFPRYQKMLEGTMVRGDESGFRELCGIQQGCEWTGNEFMPGPYHKTGGTVIVPEPQPKYEFDLPAAVEMSKPLLFLGFICIAGTAVFVVCKSMLTGLSMAFVVIGEHLGYIAAGFFALVALRFFFTRTPDAVENNNTTTNGSIFVNVNINGQNHIQQ